MTTGQMIRHLRVIAGITQEELGRIAGVSSMAVSQWENDRALPRMGAVERMAAYFGVPKMKIIEGTEDTTNYYLANFDSYLTKDEQQLIELYRKMDTRARHDLLTIAASLSPASDSVKEEGVA